MAIRDWPESERPREKLLAQGAQTLTDAELLAIFLRTGVAGKSAVDLARELLVEYGGLRALLAANRKRFCRSAGLGVAKFVQLQATLEISRRHWAEQLQRSDALTSPELTERYLHSCLRDKQYEVFALLLLDNQHRVIKFVELFRGTLDSAAVYPREVVRLVLDHQAAVILAHNHPSGVAEPSASDRAITERLQQALNLVDVRVLDHLVIGDGDSVSFRQRGWIA